MKRRQARYRINQGPRYSHSEITSIACWYCGAAPGTFCVKSSGTFAPWPHRARIEALPDSIPWKEAHLEALRETDRARRGEAR